MMKILAVVCLTIALTVGGLVLRAQEKASVQMTKPAALHAGGPIALDVTLNESLPQGAYFQIRISPISADQQINLNSGDAADPSRKKFHVTGQLPDGAIPGKWHITVIYLFLQGVSWTGNTIKPNDVTFEVDGKPFAIPTTADVSVGK